MTFDLKIINPCTSAVITPPSVIDKTYYVLSGSSLNLVLPIFQQDLVHATCTQFTYQLLNSNDSPIDSTIFTFDPLTRSLTVNSNDNGKIGIYTLKYKAYIIQPSVTNFMTFKVTLKHICEQVVITSANSQTIEYREKDPAVDIINLAFTADLNFCGSFTYSLSNDDNSVYDSSIFTFDPVTPKITLQTNLASAVATYKLKLTGTLDSYASKSILITVKIVLGCADTVITPKALPDQIYLITNPSKKIIFQDWTSSVTLCGPFTYSASNNDNSPLDNTYINFDPATRTFNVQSSNIAHIGIKVIKIVGTLADGATSSLTFNLNIKNPCSNTVITAPNLSVIKYYMFGPDLNQILPQFSQNTAHPTCSQMTYQITNTDDTPIDASIFQFTPSTRNLLVSSTDPAQIKIHTLKYSVYILSPSVSASITVTIEILHICTIVYIKPVDPRTVLYGVNYPTQTVSSLDFEEDQSGLCGTFTYSLTNEDGSPIDTTLFTFDADTPSISVFTSDSNDIKSYPLELTGTLGAWGSQSSIITIKVVNSCTLTTIGTDTINNQVYYLTDAVLTFNFAEWTSSEAGCGQFSYSARNFDGTQLNSAFINFSPSSKEFSVGTSDIQYKGTHLIELIGNLIDGATETISFQIEIINPCENAIITTPAPLNQVFTIPTQTTLDYVIPAFNQNLAHPSCQIFTYFLENDDGSPLDSSIFTFTEGTTNLRISTSDIAKMGTYKLKMTGYLLDQSKQQSATFQVQIKHECETVIITPPGDKSVTYYNKDPSKIINALTFTENKGVCGPFTYKLTNQDNTPFDSQVFTFYGSTPSITLTTNDIAKVGVYKLKVEGKLGVWGSAVLMVQVTIYKACSEANIIPYSIRDQLYQIYSGDLNIQFLEWSVDTPGCGTFTYTVSNILGQPLDSTLMTYSSGTKTITVNSNDMTRQREETQVRIVGSLNGYQTKQIIFKIKLVCAVNDLFTTFAMDNQVYYLNSKQIRISAPQIYQQPNCGYPITQNARIINGEEMNPLPHFIEYDKNQFVIFTDQEYDSANSPYKIRVNYWLHDEVGKKESYYEFSLSILTDQYFIKGSNSLPEFEKDLETLVTIANQPFIVFNFPKTIDKDNEHVTLKVDCKQIQNFGTCEGSQILLKPQGVDVGTYNLPVTLRDSHKPPGVSNYLQTIVVRPEIKVEEEKEEEGVEKVKETQPMPISKDLKVKIKSTKENGILVLQFSKNIIMPPKEQLDESVLSLRIFKNLDQQVQQDFSWEVLETTSNSIVIKLHFQNALSVSDSMFVIKFI